MRDDQLWSGDGLVDRSDYEFVKRGAGGVALYRNITKRGKRPRTEDDEINEALALLNGDQTEEEDMRKSNSLVESIAKSLEQDPERAQLVKAQLDAGVTSVAKVAGELALESLAADIRKAATMRGENMSPEQAYCRAMELHPALAEIVIE